MDQERFDRLEEIIDDACNDFQNIDMEGEIYLEDIVQEIWSEFKELKKTMERRVYQASNPEALRCEKCGSDFEPNCPNCGPK